VKGLNQYYLFEIRSAVELKTANKCPISLLQIGTYQIAVMAKSLSKPFYVVAESFKFVRLFPLKQTDIRNIEKVGVSNHG